MFFCPSKSPEPKLANPHTLSLAQQHSRPAIIGKQELYPPPCGKPYDWIYSIPCNALSQIAPSTRYKSKDDFLARTATPLEDIFKSLVCLSCILCLRFMKDTCIPEEKMLGDPRRLYAPGRLYHIVERKPFRCGRFPPIVRTAVPADGRFEHIVLSCNATSDHSIVWIEREAKRALQEQMVSKISEQSQSDISAPLSENQIFKEVFGKKSIYMKGSIHKVFFAHIMERDAEVIGLKQKLAE